MPTDYQTITDPAVKKQLTAVPNPTPRTVTGYVTNVVKVPEGVKVSVYFGGHAPAAGEYVDVLRGEDPINEDYYFALTNFESNGQAVQDFTDLLGTVYSRPVKADAHVFYRFRWSAA